MFRRLLTGASLFGAIAVQDARRAAYAQTIDVQLYTFGIELPDTGRSIVGRATILFARSGASPDSLRLDLVGMRVDSVKASPSRTGVRMGYRYDGRVLAIALPAWRADIDAWYATVYYHGEPSDGLLIGATARGRRAVFAENWPERARYWLPVVDSPRDKALVRWEIEAPARWRVVAGGRELERRPLPSGRARTVISSGAPIPAYTMVLAAAEFAVSRHRPVGAAQGEVPIEVWTYAEDSAYADSAPFRRATEIVEVMQRLVGPFPYPRLAHVESQTHFDAMENSAAIFYAEEQYGQRRMREGVVRHETAHQWLGDAVTPREWQHLWLSEGFASYFDYVIGAALDGDSVLARGMRRSAEVYMRSSAVNRPIVDATVSDPMQLLNANSYQKGAWVLHMLRDLVGDSSFFRGIREYYRAYRDSSVVSEDFQRVMERVSGQDFGWFFRQWLHQPGYPELNVDFGVDSAASRATLKIRQVQPGAWGRFRVPRVKVHFFVYDEFLGERTFALDPEGLEQVVSFDLGRLPTGIRIDPDGRLLMTVTVRRESR